MPCAIAQLIKRSLTAWPEAIHAGEPVSTPASCNSIAYAASNGRDSRCKSWCGHHSTEHVRHRRGNGPENRCAPQRRPECDSLVLRHYSSLSSSTAEHSVDNRKTVERHHAEGPFYPNAGWLRQMSGGLKIRRGWRATNSSDQFHRGIDVTATCESSKLITSGQHRHVAPFPRLRGWHSKAPIS